MGGDMVGKAAELVESESRQAQEGDLSHVAVSDSPMFAGAVIVTESGSDLTPEEARRMSVYVLPMRVEIEGVDCLDEPTLPQRAFESYNRTGRTPKTSAVSPCQYRYLFQELRERHPRKYILHLSYSAATTATYENARLGGEGIPGIIHVDTKAASSGMAAVVGAMARFLVTCPSATREELASAAESLANRARLAFIPSDLAFLRSGGRLTNAEYLGASLLRISPTIEMVDGELACTQKRRGSFAKACKEALAAKLAKERFEPGSLFLLESTELDSGLKADLEEVARAAGHESVPWRRTHGVVSCHCGPNTFGFGGLAPA